MADWTRTIAAWCRRNLTGERDFAGADPDFGRAAPGEPGPVVPAANDVETQLNDWVDGVDQIREATEDVLDPPKDPLHVDAGSTLLGFVRGVVQKVLIHAIAYEPKRDENKASGRHRAK